jgi:SpoVK/Ycf46/Vps4 family AAA+-type ATPase
MATNFNQNIDSAFQRRIHFSVYFPLPDEKSRLGIWQNIFPGKTPVSESIKFDILAKKLEICGGSIKNIALQAAFLAADQIGNGEKIIGISEILKACTMEYKKIGRLWDDTMLTDDSF